MNNSIQISCDKRNLQVVRNFVTEFLRSYAITEIVKNQIVLAVDEISANLIIHANQEDNSKYICLTIFHQNGGFLFEITDKGISFDRSKYKEPDLDHFIGIGKKGGIGLALVNRIMDSVEFTTDKKGTNICRLYKKVQTAPKSNSLIHK